MMLYANDSRFDNIDYVDLVTSVHPQTAHSVITSMSSKPPKFRSIMSEAGLCFSLNSIISTLELEK